ncbi:putative phage protein (TIGR02218 family) [Blastomonas natatoria]|uniref:Putative phage protein (TIGR02218 family) n=1 Tax=Blastomonas natatoria TaxID=34015 RepID=A0A2V3V8Q0_9SPHN|nr:DUF2163 domain-containing protein [Blastomonas natatoria]PXW78143.1 putative phage protein (TIGR02218 family) [Blastomonas natatoria]
MRTRWFDRPLETIAMLWRIERADGIALGFVAHDRDLIIDHVRYHAAPGMLPSAIEMDDGLEPLDMDVGGALSHVLIRQDDLEAGRWDQAAIAMGLADWERPQDGVMWFWHGHLGALSVQGQRFSAELRGIKARLDRPFAPVSSPSCRADFCGPGCGLSRTRFEQVAALSAVEDESLRFAGVDEVGAERLAHGLLRWIDGDNAGLQARIVGQEGGALLLETQLASPAQPGDRALLVEGCDKSFATCANRFENAHNFRGEPHLPGNDLLTRFATF